ncbi:MAG TPA: dihydroorotase [Gammaproteobacteria bacterium]|nr:dihydroorotase [Gammaproteobacteria bacterium]
MKLAIVNGRLIDPENGIDAERDLYIAHGTILAVGEAPPGFQADERIDAAGKVVCPGLVDLSARLREPGQEHKATIASETRAAASAGITSLCCPPDTDPVVDTPAVAELIRQRAEAAGFARVYPLGALTQALDGTRLSEMAALKAAHCVGVSNALTPLANTQVLRRAMEYAATFDLTVFLHAEDPWLRNDGCAHEGMVSTRLGLPGIPEAAETVAVARDLALIEHTGARAHFCRLSTGKALRMVARAQYDGLPVTADVSAHHLFLTEMDIGDFNSQCHILPPLRTLRDRDALRAGITGTTLAAICSDHQPHEPDAKLAPFSETASGISSLETLLPLTLRLVDEQLLTLSDALARLTCQPARILGIDGGTLGPGKPADVCIFDPDAYRFFSEKDMISRGRNTPFSGWELRGRVTHTLMGGMTVYKCP